MAVAPEPGGQTSGSAHAGKEASAGIKTAVACTGQFVELLVEAPEWGSLQGQDRTGPVLLAWLRDLPFPGPALWIISVLVPAHSDLLSLLTSV